MLLSRSCCRIFPSAPAKCTSSASQRQFEHTMPRTAPGCAARRKKAGTNNPKSAAARDVTDAAAARAAAIAAARPELPPEPEPETVPPETRPAQQHLSPHEERLRRSVIEYEYVQLNSPPEDMWHRGKEGYRGTVLKICDRLGWPCDDQKYTRLIWRTLRAIEAGQGERGRGGGYEGQGRDLKLTHGEALIVAHCLRQGQGQVQAMHVVQEWRETNGRPGKVTRHAVREAFIRLGVKRYRRCGCKTGNKDPESLWATARLAQALQWRRPLSSPAPCCVFGRSLPFLIALFRTSAASPKLLSASLSVRVRGCPS